MGETAEDKMGRAITVVGFVGALLGLGALLCVLALVIAVAQGWH